jgi:hypothetical protein
MIRSRAEFVCDRCSKQLRLSFISDTPVCPRCTGVCRIQELRDEPVSSTPLEELVQRVISKAAIESRLFKPAKKLLIPKESVPSCALLEHGHSEEKGRDPSSPVIGESYDQRSY